MEDSKAYSWTTWEPHQALELGPIIRNFKRERMEHCHSDSHITWWVIHVLGYKVSTEGCPSLSLCVSLFLYLCVSLHLSLIRTKGLVHNSRTLILTLLWILKYYYLNGFSLFQVPCIYWVMKFKVLLTLSSGKGSFSPLYSSAPGRNKLQPRVRHVLRDGNSEGC